MQEGFWFSWRGGGYTNRGQEALRNAQIWQAPLGIGTRCGHIDSHGNRIGQGEILPFVKIPLVANAHPLQVNPGIGFLSALEGFSFVRGWPLPDNPLNRMIEMVFLMPDQEGWQHPVRNPKEVDQRGNFNW